MKKFTSALIFAALLSSCSSWDALKEEPIPEKQAVQDEVQSRWLGEGPQQTEIGEEWWQQFGDEELNKLFSEAFINYSLLLKNGNIALGTQNHGVYILDQDKNILLHLDKGKVILKY